MPRWAIMKRSMLSGGPAYAIALAALLSLHLNTSAQDPSFRAIRRAPPFGIGELGAEFADDRLTNGGSLSNARFSPLTEIDTSDIAAYAVRNSTYGK